MLNFEFWCPTKVIFGKGMIAKLPNEIDKNKKVLITYGGGSIKQNGVYDQVMKALSGYNVLEFGGIEANPRYETLMKAVDLVKKEKVDFLLAVGGGSVLDGTKFIAAACHYTGEPWEFMRNEALAPKTALPLASVMTLPATGSEMNKGAVISRNSTDEKLPFHSDAVYPKFSIIDPQTTFSLSAEQTKNGIVDTFVHVMELYCTFDVNSPLQDNWALGILKVLMQESKKVFVNPNDYDVRANIFWCATTGLNYWIAVGVPQDWSTHLIGHELTAFYGLDHGKTLAIVMPSLLRNQKQNKKFKLAKMATDLFGAKAGSEDELADIAIEKIEEFFHSIEVPTTLSAYNIDAKDAATKVSERFKSRKTVLGERQTITPEVTYDILMNCK